MSTPSRMFSRRRVSMSEEISKQVFIKPQCLIFTGTIKEFEIVNAYACPRLQ